MDCWLLILWGKWWNTAASCQRGHAVWAHTPMHLATHPSCRPKIWAHLHAKNRHIWQILPNWLESGRYMMLGSRLPHATGAGAINCPAPCLTYGLEELPTHILYGHGNNSWPGQHSTAAEANCILTSPVPMCESRGLPNCNAEWKSNYKSEHRTRPIHTCPTQSTYQDQCLCQWLYCTGPRWQTKALVCVLHLAAQHRQLISAKWWTWHPV